MSTRPQLAVLAALASACMAPACFSPTYEEGLACTESGECPGDLRCVTNRCVGPNFIGRYDSGFQDEADGAPRSDAATACEAGSETIEATGAIVNFTVPTCITSITIETFGAEGGGGVEAAILGGKGARMKGDFEVDEGDVLQVLVGVRGADAVRIGTDEIAAQGGGSGGGGSFVVDSAGAALIVSGAGGGAAQNTIGNDTLLPGGDGTILSDGQTGGDTGGAGGTNGEGGGIQLNAGFHSGTGGGGFSGPGVGSSNGSETNGTPNAPGSSFAEGGAGGVAGSEGRDGGFGGGGSAGFTGGGGGGYSGGGGGTLFNGDHSGGGGGSLNTGTNQDNSPGVRTGDGQVIIVWSP